ncbi:MAG: hypothetical protein RIS56_1487 [Verrucomicrobiota bacterium]
MDEAVKLLFLDVPAQTALFNGLAHVLPFESVLSVVVVVEVAEDRASVLFSQHGLHFVGGAVNFFGSPEERDFVRPVVGEELVSFADALQCWTELLQ